MMKTSTNYFLILTLFVFVCGSAFSQKDDDKGPDLITITAGWSAADLVIDGEEVTDVRHGFFGGVRKDFKLAPIFSLNTGILYVQKGATFKFGDAESEWELDYLELPVGLKAKLGPVFATAGLSANIRINSQIDGEKTSDIEDFDVNAFALSSSLGLGVKILMFSVDARWQYGFTDIISDNDGDAVNNNYFLIGLGFGIGGR